MVGEVAADGRLQVDQRAEDTAAEPAACHGREEGLDGIQSGTRSRCVVEGPARVSGEPSADLRVLMAGVVIEDGVNELAGWRGRLDRNRDHPRSRTSRRGPDRSAAT